MSTKNYEIVFLSNEKEIVKTVPKIWINVL